MKMKFMIKDTKTKSVEDIKVASAVLERQIEGIQAIEDWLGEEFVAAVDILRNSKGRVILSGMGKSGHIARKIAATMASTGTPSMFVHPGEASHGDLGMITKDDVVILLSNSGETAELKDIIVYCQRFSIPIIGIVRRKTSVLVEASTVALVLPEVPEACSVKAPTTSTTMMLVLGDALAVTLLEGRGFTGDEFSVFHPGGKLGSAFVKVENLMHTGDLVPLIKEGVLMTEALDVMTEKSLGCVGIVNSDGNLLGIITDGDLRRHISIDIKTAVVNDVMTKNPLVAKRSDLASKALSVMESKSITNLFVVENNKPIGVLHIHDILKAGVV
jgi:arabinose-5-phosphate isomerase